jgi:signal transduction histidine kinase
VGLGLAIVASIAEAHGGSARVESETGSGATFIVEIPLEEPPPASAEDIGSPPEPGSPSV